MKLLFNLDVMEGNRVRARPSDYLKSLPADRQITEVREFLAWAENAARNDPDQQAQAEAEAEIGIATAKEYLEKLENSTARIYTGKRHE